MLKEAHFVELPLPTHPLCMTKFVHCGIMKVMIAATNRLFVGEVKINTHILFCV
jgi:hypothetical protein